MTNEELIQIAETFKKILTDRATSSGFITLENYQYYRTTLISSKLKLLVPEFVKNCRTPDEYWEFIKNKFPSYAERRNYIREEFNPLLNELESLSYDNKNMLASFKDKVDSKYISQSIDLMISLQKENPTEAIGKAKELVESCCKTILETMGISYEKNDDLSDLTKKTFKILNLLPEDIDDDLPLSKTLKQILGSLRGVTSGLAELRNPYGSGHGKSATYKGLSERHAKLAVGCCSTLVTFLWDCYEFQISKKH